ncbi:hypothetical protein C0Q70_20095 [Pomacea canaliculata]|uniref:RING-type domain-containing protein n=1 Tax=Pomacea canaliculata TaxID=400727 RepID=A0A2T7NEN3_POMCA|nr:hypothetical protein C0Q70_20095 [Pomacea canaliculata]
MSDDFDSNGHDAIFNDVSGSLNGVGGGDALGFGNSSSDYMYGGGRHDGGGATAASGSGQYGHYAGGGVVNGGELIGRLSGTAPQDATPAFVFPPHEPYPMVNGYLQQNGHGHVTNGFEAGGGEDASSSCLAGIEPLLGSPQILGSTAVPHHFLLAQFCRRHWPRKRLDLGTCHRPLLAPHRPFAERLHQRRCHQRHSPRRWHPAPERVHFPTIGVLQRLFFVRRRSDLLTGTCRACVKENAKPPSGHRESNGGPEQPVGFSYSSNPGSALTPMSHSSQELSASPPPVDLVGLSLSENLDLLPACERNSSSNSSSHSSSSSSSSSSSVATPTAPCCMSAADDGKVELRRCVVCRERPTVAALVPCGHNLFCMECASKLLEMPPEKRVCPACDEPFSQAIRIRLSKESRGHQRTS